MTECAYILLKWGTLKGWDLRGNEATKAKLVEWEKLGSSLSAMAQHDTPEQKQLLCQAIDMFDGEIQNDWSGEKYTKEQAKDYIMKYGERL